MMIADLTFDHFRSLTLSNTVPPGLAVRRLCSTFMTLSVCTAPNQMQPLRSSKQQGSRQCYRRSCGVGYRAAESHGVFVPICSITVDYQATRACQRLKGDFVYYHRRHLRVFVCLGYAGRGIIQRRSVSTPTRRPAIAREEFCQTRGGHTNIQNAIESPATDKHSSSN